MPDPASRREMSSCFPLPASCFPARRLRWRGTHAHEDARSGAVPGGDRRQAENSTPRNSPPLGTDVGPSDGLPSQRLVPDGDPPEAGERRDRPAAADGREVDRPVPSGAVAARDSDPPGDRSARRRNEACRIRRGRRRARDAPPAVRDARAGGRLAPASNLRHDVAGRLAPVGIPAHGSSPSAIWRVSAAPQRRCRLRGHPSLRTELKDN
jgi:hypothetical protein